MSFSQRPLTHFFGFGAFVYFGSDLGYCHYCCWYLLACGVSFVRLFAMHRSSSTSTSSSSYSSSLSITSFVQYAFLAALAYILAGAPLSSLLTSRTDGDAASSGSSFGAKRDARGIDVKAKLEDLVIPEKNLSCAAHAYKGVYVLSREPLMVYIEGFVSEEEGKEVVVLRYVILVLLFSTTIWKEPCFHGNRPEPVKLHTLSRRSTNKMASFLLHFCVLRLTIHTTVTHTSHLQLYGPPAPNPSIHRSATRKKLPYPAVKQSNASKSAPASSKAGDPTLSSRNFGARDMASEVITHTTTTGALRPREADASVLSWCIWKRIAQAVEHISRV